MLTVQHEKHGKKEKKERNQSDSRTKGDGNKMTQSTPCSDFELKRIGSCTQILTYTCLGYRAADMQQSVPCKQLAEVAHEQKS